MTLEAEKRERRRPASCEDECSLVRTSIMTTSDTRKIAGAEEEDEEEEEEEEEEQRRRKRR